MRAQLGLPIMATYLDSQAFSAVQTRSKAELDTNPKLDELFSYADQYMDNEIFVLPNQKDWDAGYDRITELLTIDPDHRHPVTGAYGAPHIYVAATCVNWINEIEGYMWKKLKISQDFTEEPVDKNDHHMDGFNGFLTSRPASLRQAPIDTRPDWLLRELDELENSNSGHMGV